MRLSPLPYELYSIAEAAASIAEGEEPWYALGSFLHDWWCADGDVRTALIAEAPPSTNTLEEKRWGALCAAIVEELCIRTSVLCPDWTEKPKFFLDEPWFYFPQASQQEWLLSTTPKPFRRRNVFVGGNVLDNKYELQQVYSSKPKWSVWTDEELQQYRNHATNGEGF